MHGSPGVGKTALGVHAATRAAGRFPGRVAFLDCRGTSRTPADPASLTARLRQVFAARERGHRLVVLDDVADERQVAPLLTAAGTAAVIITSRGPLPRVDATMRLPLPPLSVTESVALLTAITGAPADAASAAVAKHCGHLPLAVRIAGNRLTARPGWTMAHLADRLADEERRLATLSAGDMSVEMALVASFTRLSRSARALSHRLAHAAVLEFDAERAANIADIDVVAARTAVNELLAAGLLEPAGSAGPYRYHNLVRLFARRLGR